ncbi:response regulator transcription factor [Aminipila terrae]|uniref:Stage 0 sporulation protein A homolog n=1 Tax=Aminipila terrae TaxID=2697030 RepID=A0A6P1MJD1_9FIRM|nr:response regulator transcription factor [Aminipila terrae]QHI71716.1 response regulator [Aminipila terrae]
MDKTQKILVVDDDADIREVLHIQLENKGYCVLEAENGRKAIGVVTDHRDIDLIILDIMMPILSGIDACMEIRKLSAAPILFLTAKSKETDKAIAYENGGDDYLVKPFSQAELLMKVQSLLRRYYIYKGKAETKTDKTEIHLKDLIINTADRTVFRGKQRIELTDTEFQILMYLERNRGAAQDSKAIYEGVWGGKFLPSSANAVMVHILNLRKKLELDFNPHSIIHTVWGKGYQIDEE